MNYCNSVGIWREFTAPRTPQQNGPVESAIARVFEAGHAARLRIKLFPDVRLEETRSCNDDAGASLWLESLLWGSECFNRVATSINDQWLSPYQVFDGNRPPLPLLPFFHPAFYRTLRKRKTEPGVRVRYFLNFGYNHGRGNGKVVYSRDVTWHNPEVPLVTPMRVPPRDISVLVPKPKSVNATPPPAPAPARVLTATPPVPAPIVATTHVPSAPEPPTPTSTAPKFPALCPRACPTRVGTRRI